MGTGYHKIEAAMNEIMNVNKVQTMSSREIAELTGKAHKNVLRDIENMLKALNLEQNSFLSFVNDGPNGRPLKVYNLPKEETLILVSGYNVQMRAAIIRRWQELEAQVAKPLLPDFTDPVAAARAWADEVEQRLLAQQREKEALEYVDRQARYIDNLENQLRDGLTLPEFAKRLNGVNVQRVSEWAIAKGWVRRHGKLLVTSSQGRSGGYVYDKDGTYINPKTGEEMYTSKVQLTNAGARKMYREYLKLNLPMKKSWNGEFSNNPFKD